MKLKQLLYIVEICNNELNVSHTAEALFTSQPGVSKQVRQLKQELGVTIFRRNGKQLSEITAAGQQIINHARVILEKAQRIKDIAQRYKDNRVGTLTVGTTHNQARYVLPEVIDKFIEKYPGIKFHIHQGTPTQVAEEASRGLVDIAIASEAMELYDNLVVLPCREWSRCLLIPRDHPLTKKENIELKDIAEYQIVTYVSGYGGRSLVDKAFEKSKIQPNIVLTAVDADVIKTYVRIGLGVGIVAAMAYDASSDQDLVSLDATHLFGESVTKIGFRRDLFFAEYVYDFIQLFSSKWDKEKIRLALRNHIPRDRFVVADDGHDWMEIEDSNLYSDEE